MLGNILLGQQKLAEAQAVFEGLVKSEPKNPTGYYRLGMVYHLRKQYDPALQNYDKALAINPALLDVFSNVVQLLAEQKQYDKAFERCNRMMQQVEASPAALGGVYDLKGALHHAKGETRAAEEAFQTAIQKNPNLLRPYYSLAGIYLKEQNADKAVDQFKSLLQVNPRQSAPNMMIGVIYDSQKKFDLSEKYYRAALEINPRFAPAANNLAYILAEGNRDLNDALKYAQTAKEQMPDDPSVMDTLGWVYYQKGVYDSAIGEFKGSLAEGAGQPDRALPPRPGIRQKGRNGQGASRGRARPEAQPRLHQRRGRAQAAGRAEIIAAGSPGTDRCAIFPSPCSCSACCCRRSCTWRRSSCSSSRSRIGSRARSKTPPPARPAAAPGGQRPPAGRIADQHRCLPAGLRAGALRSVGPGQRHDPGRDRALSLSVRRGPGRADARQPHGRRA